MAPRNRYKTKVEILQGTLDLLILQTLQWGAQHGYAIAQAIRARSGDTFAVDTGSLYPALHRLERHGWIAAAWTTSDAKQRVRQYRITATGRRQLVAERSRWQQLLAAMAGVLKAEET